MCQAVIQSDIFISQGDWIINVKKPEDKLLQKVFQVKEYVLPKFEVAVNGPPYVLADADEVTFEVCGM